MYLILGEFTQKQWRIKIENLIRKVKVVINFDMSDNDSIYDSYMSTTFLIFWLSLLLSIKLASGDCDVKSKVTIFVQF